MGLVSIKSTSQVERMKVACYFGMSSTVVGFYIRAWEQDSLQDSLSGRLY